MNKIFKFRPNSRSMYIKRTQYLNDIKYYSLSHKSTSVPKLEDVRKLVNILPEEEKREILLELQLEESMKKKKEAEAKLASWTWRSKFGRPASVLPTKVDATGTYCEISEDWLMKKVAENTKTKPPTFAQLRQIVLFSSIPFIGFGFLDNVILIVAVSILFKKNFAAVFNALPFVGFGFLDNLIMIVAGDYIDTTIGVYLGISTMAAAALGNTVSDLAGIGSAFYVENVAAKIGVRAPDLASEQLNMSSSRWCANIGRGIGVCLGCILGMFPLLFLPAHTKNKRVSNTDE